MAIKVAIHAALKEEAKNKDEETGVEYWSVYQVKCSFKKIVHTLNGDTFK